MLVEAKGGDARLFDRGLAAFPFCAEDFGADHRQVHANPDYSSD
jgi:hypothetical protein